MTRLLIHVEGLTEETFVNEVIAPHLYDCGYSSVAPRLLGNSRQRYRRGGIKPWSVVRKDILRHLRADSECISTTMVDYYGLPKVGPRAWPGRDVEMDLTIKEKAEAIQNALLNDIHETLGGDIDDIRFIPYIMMHEFEGLLFSDCTRFGDLIGRPAVIQELQRIRDSFATPEDINDSPQTAPSKRIEALIPNYEKPLFGTLVALDIGLPTIRQECPLFNEWLTTLEEWPNND